MPAFVYKARMLTGGLTEGTLQADDQRAAVDQLRGQKLVPLEINEAPPDLMARLNALMPFRGGVSAKDLVLFSRQLSTLVSAGVPLVQGLTILEEQVESKIFKGIVHTIKDDIEAGQ